MYALIFLYLFFLQLHASQWLLSIVWSESQFKKSLSKCITKIEKFWWCISNVPYSQWFVNDILSSFLQRINCFVILFILLLYIAPVKNNLILIAVDENRPNGWTKEAMVVKTFHFDVADSISLKRLACRQSSSLSVLINPSTVISSSCNLSLISRPLANSFQFDFQSWRFMLTFLKISWLFHESLWHSVFLVFQELDYHIDIILNLFVFLSVPNDELLLLPTIMDWKWCQMELLQNSILTGDGG